MSHDPLGDAIRALREEGEAPAPQSRLTRERILRDLRPRAKSRRWVWGVPLAALLAGSTVLAATGQLPALVETAARVLSGKPQPVKPGTASAPRAVPSAALTPSSANTAQPPAPEPETPAIVTGDSTPGITANPANPARPEASARRAARAADAGVRTRPVPAETPAPAPAAPTPEGDESAAAKVPETDETLALYRKARRLHFVDQNPGAALAAWDAYLAKGPRGPLVVDARYDRALCLVRLGRRAEARAALEPFAEGRYGSYRQKEAKALLEALQSP